MTQSTCQNSYRIENTLVCAKVVEKRGSFIAGPSTRNQRIETMWRDVLFCVVQRPIIFSTPVRMDNYSLLTTILMVLHLAFLPRINQALNEFKELHNNHQVQTENNWTPN